jgi:hypothetical protein
VQMIGQNEGKFAFHFLKWTQFSGETAYTNASYVME